ncbi:MAG: hypothetical protein ACMG6S_31625, partial [Byssovorax sp.]
MDPQHADADEPAPPPSDDIESLLAEQKRRRTRLLAVSGGLVGVIAGGLFALATYQSRQAEARIATAFGSLSRCLVGGPLEPRESAGTRVRRLQLTAMTLPDDQRAMDGGQSWPDRCSTFAYQLDEALRDAGRATGDKDLAQAAAKLGKQLKEPTSFSADLTEPVETVWSLSELEKIQGASAVAIAGPPGRAEPLDADGLARGTPLAQRAFSFKTVFTEPHPALDLRVLVDDPGAPLLCTIKRAAAPAKCAALPKEITASKQGLRLIGTSDDGAAPLIFAGNRGSEGIFRADGGELVDRFYAYGGYAAADGFSAVLGWKEQEKELVATRKLAGTPKTQAKLTPAFRTGNPYYSAQMLWDQVLLRGVTKDDRRRLFAQLLERTGDVLGEAVDVGELSEPGLIQGGLDEPPHITGCKTAEAMVVRVKGYDNDFMTFRLAGTWSAPVSPEMTGGTLSCSKSTAAITRVEPAASSFKTTFRQVRCTSAGCRTDEVQMEQLLHRRVEFAPKEGHADAVDLDGKLLIVWAAGERGGVRVRVAPAEAISRAPDVILYDDLIKDGHVQPLSTLFDLKLFSREG